jgi:hypothetical protein
VADRHLTDEEIHQASGNKPRMPAGIPKATCLACGDEHDSFYASMAHDCRIVLRDRHTYGEWLIKFQRWGYGVLKTPEDMKFPWDFKVTGQLMLTEFLQSDLFVAEGHELKDDWYTHSGFLTHQPKRPRTGII